MYNYVNFGCYYVRMDENSRSFDIGHEKYGVILSGCKLTAYARNLKYAHHAIQADEFSSVTCGHELHMDGKGLSVCFSGGPEYLAVIVLRISIRGREVIVSVDAAQGAEYYYEITGYALWGKKPETDTFAVYSNYTGKGIRCAVGPAAGRGCDSLFDRQTDSMLTLTGSPVYSYDYEVGAYQFSECLKMDSMSFKMIISERVLAERFGLRKYKPMNNETVFKRPPVGWMTWYAVKFNACEESVLGNTRIQKEKLKAYGADAIWVDWEWYHKCFEDFSDGGDTFHPNPDRYPNGLGYVADEIRKAGFVPCIWIGATHEVCENEFLRECPDALLVKRKSWCGDWWFDPTHPRYLNEFIPRVFRQLIDEWRYEAIKWDALPLSLDYYDQYHDNFYDTTVTAEQALRTVEQTARDIVGDKVYMLSCSGNGDKDITLSTDIFDAARIGGDIFGWSEFLVYGVQRLCRYYPLHNIVQYCDPDNLVVRPEFNTEDQAVSRASLAALLGTPITLGDDLRELPEERFEIIRRAIPPMNTHPMFLESQEMGCECEIVNTFIRTRWDEYQVVDVFNITDSSMTYRLRFADLDLDSETDYLIYDYWNHEFLGKHRQDITLSFRACQSRVLVVRKVLEHPQLVSTSRHITQGAFEIEKLVWDNEKAILSGISQTVPGEDYTITVYDPAANRSAAYTFTPNGERLSWDIDFSQAK